MTTEMTDAVTISAIEEPRACEQASERSDHPATPRVVILGGGVAGLTAAYELRRRLGELAEITVIAPHEMFALGPALLWVPFGRKTSTIGFSIARALERRQIEFIQAGADGVDPARRIVVAAGQAIPYNYLLVATGPRADGTAIPGVTGQFNATTSIWSDAAAMEAGHALERVFAHPGSIVVGAAQGAAYLSAAYEFVLSLDTALRRRGTRDQATLTFITPEPSLGDLDIGAPAARRAMERLFRRRGITALTGVGIKRVDRDSVTLCDGRALPAAYTMIIPPFTGVVGIWKSPGLTDERGFVPVDAGAGYRHLRYPEIYAAGVGARPIMPAPLADAWPKTGYLSTIMAKRAAQAIAAAISGKEVAGRPLPRLLDLRLIDGGESGILLLSADLARPRHLALPLPGRLAHRAKGLLTRYLLWKLRTGRTALP